MAVSQQFIDLLNVPLPRLKRIAADLGAQVEKDLTKWDLAAQLADVPRGRLVKVAGDWLFAGTTSITWLILGDATPISEKAWTKAVNDHIDADVEEDDIRPDEVTVRPQLVDMYRLEKNKLVCTFAVAKRVNRVIHNFELTDVYADEFFVAVVRLEHGLVEVRGSHERARRLASTWLAAVADLLPEEGAEVRA